MSDRRRYTRHPIQVPVDVSTNVRRHRVGMIRDLSIGGILFHSLSKYAVGERLALVFKLKKKNGSTGGYVVRTETDDHPDNIFRFVTAVRFDAPLLDLELADLDVTVRDEPRA